MRTLAVMHLAEAHGPPQHVRPWLAALAERGTLEVVVPGEGYALELYAPLAAITVLPYAPLTFPRTPLDAGRLAASTAREVRTFRRHIRRSRPDLVVVTTTVLPAALVAAWLERVPTTVYVGELFDKGFPRSAARTASGTLVKRLTEHLASALVCCSHTAARQFVARDGTIVETVYPGVGSAWQNGNREAFRHSYGIAEDALCIAVVGNITRGRGQDLVIRALPRIRRDFPDARCLIAGVALDRPVDVTYRGDLDRLAEELGVSDAVVFTGFIDAVADLYAGTDIVVNPARLNEALGRVALEAMSAGRPVIASRVGAIPEVLRDGHDALLVEPGDPVAIAEAVLRLWTDDELRRRLVRQGRARVLSEFTEERGVERFASVVDEVLRRRADGAGAPA